MRNYSIERLSPLDRSSLRRESAGLPQHLGVVFELDAPAPLDRAGYADILRIRHRIAERLDDLPAWRQRLEYIPYLFDRYWVDDASLDLRERIQSVTLPGPGGERQMRRRCTEILERPLSREDSPWEVWVIDGMEHGRCALLFKVHVSLVARMGGPQELSVFFDQTAAPPSDRTWMPRPLPGAGTVLRKELGSRLAAGFRELGRRLQQPLETAGRTLDRWLGPKSGADRSRMLAPADPGPHRRLGWVDVSLDEIREIGQSLGGTVNDVALATLGGGFARLLQRRGRIDPAAELRVALTVGSRLHEGEPAVCHVGVPASPGDPFGRLRAIRERTLLIKDTAQAPIARAPFDVSVGSLAGPTGTLTFLGAPVSAIRAHLPLTGREAVTTSVVGFGKHLSLGLVADWDGLPDMEALSEALHDSFDELRRSAVRPSLPIKDRRVVSIDEARKRRLFGRRLRRERAAGG